LGGHREERRNAPGCAFFGAYQRGEGFVRDLLSTIAVMAILSAALGGALLLFTVLMQSSHW
jgi:hypothetical protein